jgi:hypothetical protein
MYSRDGYREEEADRGGTHLTGQEPDSMRNALNLRVTPPVRTIFAPV